MRQYETDWNKLRNIFICIYTFHCTNLFRVFLFFSVRSVMQKYLEKETEISFDKIFNQILGECVFSIIYRCIFTPSAVCVWRFISRFVSFCEYKCNFFFNFHSQGTYCLRISAKTFARSRCHIWNSTKR